MERKIDYTIGDEIVCVRTHSQGVVKEGQIFTCLGLKQDPCKKCGGYIVDVGVKESKFVKFKSEAEKKQVALVPRAKRSAIDHSHRFD